MSDDLVMEEPAQTAPHVAEAPFSDSDADIVLRSSDNVDFRLHKFILTRAFHGFDDLLSGVASAAAYQTAQPVEPSAVDADGRPVMAVT